MARGNWWDSPYGVPGVNRIWPKRSKSVQLSRTVRDGVLLYLGFRLWKQLAETCPRCGATATARANFCTSCGLKLAATRQERRAQTIKAFSDEIAGARKASHRR